MTFVRLPLCFKLFQTIFVPHFLIFKAIEIPIDMVRFFTSEDPTQILQDIPCLIRKSASMSLYFHTEGKELPNPPQDSPWQLSLPQTEKSRRWMESVLKSEGRLLEGTETREAIERGLHH